MFLIFYVFFSLKRQNEPLPSYVCASRCADVAACFFFLMCGLHVCDHSLPFLSNVQLNPHSEAGNLAGV